VSTLSVSEHFLSIQGEGRSIGIPSVFLRLSKCNLTCGGLHTVQSKELDSGATWRCDTIEVWIKGTPYTYEVLYAIFLENGYVDALKWGAHLIITGGEPLLHQDDIGAFLTYFNDQAGFFPIIEVETNGTLLPVNALIDRVHYWNVSPKLMNSGMPKERRLLPDVLERFKQLQGCIFKFVVSDLADVQELHFDIVEPLQISPETIYLMAGADSQNLLNTLEEDVTAMAAKYGYHFSTRLHIQLWDQKTGV